MITVVTGTGTGVGKTVATAALAVRAGPQALVVKPAQTGVGTDRPDVDVVRALAGCAVAELVRLADPLAPDTAARLRGVEIPPVAAHAARIRELARGHDPVLVEGAGGVLVRLDTAGGTVLDLAVDLARDHPVRVVLVTGLGLGTLNHTELAVGALRSRGLEPGLVLGSVPAELDQAERCNLAELPRVTGAPVFGALPAGAGNLPPDRFRHLAPAWFTGEPAPDSRGRCDVTR